MIPAPIRKKIALLAAASAVAVMVAAVAVLPWFAGLRQSAFPGLALRLGLDLQGGLHLVLKVDLQRAVQNQLERSVEDLGDALKNAHLHWQRTALAGENALRLYYASRASADAALEKIRAGAAHLSVVFAAADDAGAALDVSLSPKEAAAIEDRAVLQSLEVMRNRIDQFGVAEPLIVRQGRDEIVIQLPGLADTSRAMALIGKTAQLEFKLVVAEQPGALAQRVSRIAGGGKNGVIGHGELNAALKDSLPAGTEVYLNRDDDRRTEEKGARPILVYSRAVMTGAYLQAAQVGFDDNFNAPSVHLDFNSAGARLFERITTDHTGRRLAIILDDVVHSAPLIQEPIAGGKARITGAFTAEEASDLAIVLRAGALPAPVQIVQNLTVGPSLGQDSISQGINASVLGAALVIGFMLIVYRFSGVIANAAMVLNVVLMIAAMALMKATLSLPGIAGIVLSIGMAVDTNVLIFERMREEARAGASAPAAVYAGYRNAFWTIVDAHVTTLITAMALFLFGTGPIKGFAVTLSLGIVFNLFTALFGTRVVYEGMSARRRIGRLSFLRLIGDTRIDFIGMRKVAFLCSALLVLGGLFALVQIQRGRANLGVDLSGGTMIQFRAATDFELQPVRRALADAGLVDCELQKITGAQRLMVRAKASGTETGTVADRVAGVLARQFPQQGFSMESKAEIGASVSRDMKSAALIAVGVSLLGFVAYLGWRFDLRFAVAAAAATFHDVLAVLGLFYLLDKEVTLLVITALLTLAGYSLTDTVVVFDRIRENMRRREALEMGTLINRSINEVMGRTIMTSATVFLVLAALLAVGGPLLRDFAFALLVGVVVGTYSSIFVASPIVYVWPRSARREAVLQAARRQRRKPGGAQ